jgi:hypothetical protein
MARITLTALMLAWIAAPAVGQNTGGAPAAGGTGGAAGGQVAPPVTPNTPGGTNPLAPQPTPNNPGKPQPAPPQPIPIDGGGVLPPAAQPTPNNPGGSPPVPSPVTPNNLGGQLQNPNQPNDLGGTTLNPTQPTGSQPTPNNLGGTPQAPVQQPLGGAANNSGNQTFNGGVANGLTGSTPTAQPWFNSPGIQQQLGLTGQQFQTLGNSYNTLYQNYLQQRNRMLLDKNYQPAQQQARLQELNTQFQNQLQQQFGNALDPLALQRFNQVQAQYQGYNYFGSPQIQQQFGITPEQQTRLLQLQTSWDQQMALIPQTYENNPQLLREHFNLLQSGRTAALQNLLTPQQYGMWQQTIGTPVNFGWDDYSVSSARP